MLAKWAGSAHLDRHLGGQLVAHAGGSNLSVGKWLIMVGLEEAKDARPKATPPPGGPQHGDASAAGGGRGSHKVAAKREGPGGGGGGGKLVKWEDQPGDRPNGVSKAKIGRPMKDQPKVLRRGQAAHRCSAIGSTPHA